MMFLNIDSRARERWRESRARIEKENTKNRKRDSIYGTKSRPRPIIFNVVSFILRLSGLYNRGLRNAREFIISYIDLGFPDLPASFDNYKILHLSDLHIGCIDDFPEMISNRFSELNPDLVIMTGDFQTHGTPPGRDTADMMRHLKANVQSGDGWLAVLGNHDSYDMLDALEAIDVRVLVNESVSISRGEDTLHFVGTDDVHAFNTPDSVAALEKFQDGFRIALVHTVDLATIANRLRYKLYLSGHTHGGQLCLPGGRPLVTRLDSHRQLASGKWKIGNMLGYTSRGLGHGISPFRFNCPGEATIIRLIKE